MDIRPNDQARTDEGITDRLLEWALANPAIEEARSHLGKVLGKATDDRAKLEAEAEHYRGMLDLGPEEVGRRLEGHLSKTEAALAYLATRICLIEAALGVQPAEDSQQ